jgi:L-amino acid N-acyltransferase YncA
MTTSIRPVGRADWRTITAIFNHSECGRFRRVGTKHGRDFDMVWMQLTP